MRGIIWCNKIEDGSIELERMINNYEQMGYEVNEYRKSQYYGSIVQFNNNDVWEVRQPNENNQGVRCNISYIDRTIDRYTVDTLIRHSMIATPYTAYKYFYPASEENIEVEI